MQDTNGFDPLPRALPPHAAMEGLYARLEPLQEGHLPALWQAFSTPAADDIWEYMAFGPFGTEAAFIAHARAAFFGADPQFYAIVEPDGGLPLGILALMRIDRANGVIEVGTILLSPAVQRTRTASAAMHLVMRRVFGELGYRRLEWKCDSRNERSKYAARRFGFTYEGLFRQHMIVKGRNRDTAWFSMLDREWPAVDAAFRAWLDPENFDARGRQRLPLAVPQTG
ncbi:MAG: GNAT family N-acetyltransferase [Flavobacteriaceae bacterium]